MEETGEFTIDKTIIGSLSSETRILIISSLRQRRKTNAELARELALSPPTIHHHIDMLEKAGLIAPVKNDHKWIYYELTPFGHALLDPEKKMRVSVIASSVITIVMALGVVYTYLSMPVLNIRPWVPETESPFFMVFVIALIAVIMQMAILISLWYSGTRWGS